MRTNHPHVSIIIPTYQSVDYIKKCLQSLSRQEYEDFEILVIDDGSTDGTIRVISEFNDNRVRLIQRPNETGIPSARNRGIKEARGDYIAVHDADDWSHRERLKKQVEFLDEHSNVGLVGTGAQIVAKDGSVTGRRRVLECPTREILLRTNHFVHGSVLVRREALEAIGGYDEEFQTAEDYDLYLRLTNNYKLRNIDEPLYNLRIHKESIYGNRLEETLVYRYLAVLRAQGDAPEYKDKSVESLKREVYNRLTPDQRLAAQLELARDALRYGEMKVSRKACRDAQTINSAHPLPYLLFLLSYCDPRVASATARIYRRTILNPVLMWKNIRCKSP